MLSSLAVRVEQWDLSSPETRIYCRAALYPAEGFAVTTWPATEWGFGLCSPAPCRFPASLSPLSVFRSFTLNLPTSAAKSGQGTENQHSCCPGCHTSSQSLLLSTVSVTSHPPSLPVSSDPFSLPPCHSSPEVDKMDTLRGLIFQSRRAVVVLVAGWMMLEPAEKNLHVSPGHLPRQDRCRGGMRRDLPRSSLLWWGLGAWSPLPSAILSSLRQVGSCASVSLKNGNDYAGHLRVTFWLIRRKILTKYAPWQFCSSSCRSPFLPCFPPIKI